MKPLACSAYTLVSAMGIGVSESIEALRQEHTGLSPCDFSPACLETYIGRVRGIEEQYLPSKLAAYDCRTSRLGELALAQDDFTESVTAARRRYGADRIGVFMGTSTAGIEATERAYRAQAATGKEGLPEWYHFRETHNMFAVADFVRRRLELQGVAHAVSTACSSSAKVFADAYRYIESGFCDAAVVGGMDSLCMTTLYGFSSLELVSAKPCRPGDPDRDGLSIGEAAGFVLLEKTDQADGPLFRGYGERCDAHHMATPHPQGLWAAQSMHDAITRAGISPAEIDYVNLHGTATPSNDVAEDQALAKVFTNPIPCSSTKGWTGHTLGAAGIVEAIVALLCIRESFLPTSLNTQQVDPGFTNPVLMESRQQPVHYVLSNSFGFGGNNCSLVFGS